MPRRWAHSCRNLRERCCSAVHISTPDSSQQGAAAAAAAARWLEQQQQHGSSRDGCRQQHLSQPAAAMRCIVGTTADTATAVPTVRHQLLTLTIHKLTIIDAFQPQLHAQHVNYCIPLITAMLGCGNNIFPDPSCYTHTVAHRTSYLTLFLNPHQLHHGLHGP